MTIRPCGAWLAALLLATTSLLAAPPVPPDPPRGWIGVFLEDAPDGGVQVLAVVPASPAARGGIRQGDVVIAVNGVEVVDRIALQRVLDGVAPGGKVVLTTLRGGSRRDRTVTPAARSAVPWVVSPLAPIPIGGDDLRDPIARVGLDVQPIPASLAAHYGAGDAEALLVTRVEKGGPTDTAGIRVGDVLRRSGEDPLRTREELEEILASAAPGTATPLSGVRTRQPKSWTLTLPRNPAEVDREAAARDGIRALEAEIERTREVLARLERELRELKNRR